MTPDILANEKNFLGCLLRSPHEFWKVNDTIAVEMFSQVHHREIYRAVRDLSEGGRQVTTPALLAQLPEEFDDHGPAIGVIAALKENASEAGSAIDYSGTIADQSAGKRLRELGKWMDKEVGSGKRSPEDVAAEASLRLNEIMSVASPMRPKHIGDIAHDVTRLASSAKAGDVLSGLDTGLGPLDEIMGLMLGGDLGAVIASQGDGKSAMAAQIAVHAAKAGRPVLFIQMEMSDEQMAARELAACSGIPVNQIHEGAFDAFQWEEIVNAEKKLREMRLHILDTEEMTVRQIKAQALSMQRTVGLSLIVVDQLDKIRADGKHRDRFERMAEITRDLKKMAKSLKVPVIVLAQRTRGAQRRDDPTPDVLDADAPSLERDCDWIIGLWQRANWLRRNKPDGRREEDLTKWHIEMQKAQGRAEIICLKRRRGKAFEQRELQFIGETMRFQEVA